MPRETDEAGADVESGHAPNQLDGGLGGGPDKLGQELTPPAEQELEHH